MKIGAYNTHPAADVFPLMDGAEFDRLCADIEDNGLLEPIVFVEVGGERTIVDGRNRLRACLKVGCQPRWEEFSGLSIVGYVASKNARRRQLTAAQLAMVGAELEPMFAAEAKDRQARAGIRGAGGKFQGKPVVARVPQPAWDANKASEQAAAAVGASGRSVREAKRVLRDAPSAAAAVKDGRISQRAAARIARLSELEQRRALKRIEEGEEPLAVLADIEGAERRPPGGINSGIKRRMQQARDDDAVIESLLREGKSIQEVADETGWSRARIQSTKSRLGMARNRRSDNPFRGVISSAVDLADGWDLARRESAGLWDGAAQEHLDELESSLARLAKVVQAMIKLTRNSKKGKHNEQEKTGEASSIEDED